MSLTREYPEAVENFTYASRECGFVYTSAPQFHANASHCLTVLKDPREKGIWGNIIHGLS